MFMEQEEMTKYRFRLAATLLILCFIFGGYISRALGTDWPNWRGANHDGVSDETGWVTDWPAGGPKILWEKELGIGFSSMAVSKGLVYAMGNISKNQDVIYCLNAAAGTEVWRYSYEEPLSPKNNEGGPHATPTVSSGYVYTMSKNGKVYCIDSLMGTKKWSKDLAKEYSISPPEWGFSGSALVLSDIVVFNAGSAGIALNKDTGALVWKSEPKGASYSTGVPYESGGQKVVAMFTATRLVGLNALTGKVVWQLPWKTAYNVNSADAIVVGDKFFVSSGYGTGCALLEVRGDSVTEVWRNKNMRNHCNSSVLWKGYVYGFDGQVGGKGTLTCVDFATGEKKWSVKGMGTGSLMIAGGRLVILGEKGRLVIAEPSEDGFKELASSQILSGKCWTVPVLANGRIFARNAAGRLVCVDVSGAKAGAAKDSFDWPQFRGPNRDGKSSEAGLSKKWPGGEPELLWSVKGLGEGFASVSIANGMVYTTGIVGAEKEGVISAYGVDGSFKWKQTYGKGWSGSHSGTHTTPTIDGDRVYVISGYGVVVCYDAMTGKPRWRIDMLKEFEGKNLKWGIAESALIVSEKLICTPGGKDATMVALDKMTGRTIWTTKGLSEKSAYCSPTLIERNGKQLIMTMVQNSIILVDPDNGKVVLRIPHTGKYGISAVTPIYKDGVIYATTGYGYGGKAYALSADTTSYSEKWSDKNLDCHHGGVILLGDDIVGSSSKGRGDNKNSWICLDINSGKMKYWSKLVGKGSAVYADGMFYCYGEKGQLGLVRMTPSGFEMVSSFKIAPGEGPHWAHPVICNGRLYIRHGDVLMVYNVKADS